VAAPPGALHRRPIVPAVVQQKHDLGSQASKTHTFIWVIQQKGVPLPHYLTNKPENNKSIKMKTLKTLLAMALLAVGCM
jgi:hypothetical protein